MSERELPLCPFCGVVVEWKYDHVIHPVFEDEDGQFCILNGQIYRGSDGWSRRAPDPVREALEAERDAFSARVKALEGLAACYRLNRLPSQKLLRDLDSSREALSALDAARREARS